MHKEKGTSQREEWRLISALCTPRQLDRPDLTASSVRPYAGSLAFDIVASTLDDISQDKIDEELSYRCVLSALLPLSGSAGLKPTGHALGLVALCFLVVSRVCSCELLVSGSITSLTDESATKGKAQEHALSRVCGCCLPSLMTPP